MKVVIWDLQSYFQTISANQAFQDQKSLQENFI